MERGPLFFNCWENDMEQAQELRMRAGDQELPAPNDGPKIHDLVIGDIYNRRKLGEKRYGTPLQAHNGRDALRDLYEELLDACCYIRQVIEERDNT